MDEEGNGIASRVALGPAPITVFKQEALVRGQFEVAVKGSVAHIRGLVRFGRSEAVAEVDSTARRCGSWPNWQHKGRGRLGLGQVAIVPLRGRGGSGLCATALPTAHSIPPYLAQPPLSRAGTVLLRYCYGIEGGVKLDSAPSRHLLRTSPVLEHFGGVKQSGTRHGCALGWLGCSRGEGKTG